METVGEEIAKIRRRFASPFRIIRILLPYVLYAIYILGGADILHHIEDVSTPPFSLDPRNRVVNETRNCLANQLYAGALQYAFSCASGIGFGKILACSDAGRIVTLLYSIIGVPLTVYILADVGSDLSRVLVFLYHSCSVILTRLWKNRKLARVAPIDVSYSSAVRGTNGVLQSQRPSDVTLTIEAMDAKRDRSDSFNSSPATETESRSASRVASDVDSARSNTYYRDLPLWVCIIVFLVMLFSLAAHIANMEQLSGWYPFYYALLFFFNQYYSHEASDAISVIFGCLLLIGGLGAISTAISAVLLNINNMTKRVNAKVVLEVKRQTKEAAANGLPNVDTNQVLEDVLQQEGSTFLRGVMSTAAKEKLSLQAEVVGKEVKNQANTEKLLDDLRDQRLRSTKDAQTMADPEVSEKSTDTQSIRLSNVVDQEVQTIPSVSEVSTATYDLVQHLVDTHNLNALTISEEGDYIDSIAKYMENMQYYLDSIVYIRKNEETGEIWLSFHSLIKTLRDRVRKEAKPPAQDATTSTETPLQVSTGILVKPVNKPESTQVETPINTNWTQTLALQLKDIGVACKPDQRSVTMQHTAQEELGVNPSSSRKQGKHSRFHITYSDPDLSEISAEGELAFVRQKQVATHILNLWERNKRRFLAPWSEFDVVDYPSVATSRRKSTGMHFIHRQQTVHELPQDSKAFFKPSIITAGNSRSGEAAYGTLSKGKKGRLTSSQSRNKIVTTEESLSEETSTRL